MAYDAFLKISGIEGESTDKTHKGSIEIESFSWGVSNSGSASAGGGLGAGKASFQDFSFVSRLSAASPPLFMACASGKHLPDALLTLRKAGKSTIEFLKIKLTDILVSSYSDGGAAADDSPVESVSFNFSKIEIEYRSQAVDGSAGPPVQAAWDLKENRGG